MAGPAINNPRYTLAPAALAVGLVICAVAVADLGTPVVMGAAALSVFFVAGLEIRYCAIAIGIALIGPRCFFIAKNPTVWGAWSVSSIPKFEFVSKFDQGAHEGVGGTSLAHPRHQLPADQSKIAVGAGGPTGVGLMNGGRSCSIFP